jgi:hypothetical protein
MTVRWHRIAPAAGGLLAIAVSTPALAGRYWPTTPLTDWEIYLNNGTVYISSPQMASHCTNTRGQINVGDTAYNRALYAYALSAKARGKGLKYVVDDTTTVCVIDALQEI